MGGADGGSDVPSVGEQRKRPIPEKGVVFIEELWM